MTDDKKTLKFQMMMSPTEAETLDTWMFKNRVRSRAEAIRRLTQIALTIEPMLSEIQDLWRAIVDADGKIGVTILDAKANIDQMDVATLVDLIDKSHDTLTVPALELGLQASKLQGVFDALKAGEDVEAALRQANYESEAIERTKAWVRESWGPKDRD